MVNWWLYISSTVPRQCDREGEPGVYIVQSDCRITEWPWLF